MIASFLFAEPSVDVCLTPQGSLWEALYANPNEPWDFWKLSGHPELKWDTVVAFPNKSWDWRRLSGHPEMDFEFVRAYPDKDWDWEVLSEHPRISLETIANHPEYFWKFRTREVPNDILETLPRYKKNLTSIFFIPWSIVFSNPTLDWNWENLTSRSDLTWEIILDHPDVPWDWQQLTWSMIPEHGLKAVLAFPDKPWDYAWMSTHFSKFQWCKMDWEDFWKLPHPAPASAVSGWNYQHLYRLTENPELLLKLKKVSWNGKGCRKRILNLSWDILERCMEENRESSLTFPWKDLSRRRNIPLEIVVNHVDWPWCWRSLTLYRYLTFRFCNAYKTMPWKKEILRTRFGNTAARRIQCQWRRCVADPTYLVCRRRLMWEFNQFFE